MYKINRMATTIGVTLLFAASLLQFSCSSGPDEKQLASLQTLKDEVTQLEKEIKEKEGKKAELDKVIAEKTAGLKKVNDDIAIVKQRLAK
jgi:septal ring factor EnvC (AmiA/AmiB activator)